jgi:hypothetical protein
MNDSMGGLVGELGNAHQLRNLFSACFKLHEPKVFLFPDAMSVMDFILFHLSKTMFLQALG